MSLRDMNIDIGFKVKDGPLKRADQAADDFKDNVEDGATSLDNLGSQAGIAGDTMRDEFDESAGSLDSLGYHAEDAGDMITDASEDAADSMQDLGYQGEDAGDMITDSSGDASDSLDDLGDTAGDASNVITVEFGNAADSVNNLGSHAGEAGELISDSSSYAADSINDIGTAAGDAGSSVSSAGSEASSSLSDIRDSADGSGEGFRLMGIKAETWIKGVAVGAVLALGGAFTTAAADATSSMAEIENSMYVFQAETGNSIEVAEEFGGVLQDLHSNNTDSYDELAGAATMVSQRFDVEGEALQNLTQDYLDYTKVTGQSEDAIEGLSRIQKQYGIETDGASGMLDKFLSVAQQTGAPVEGLQRNIEQFGPVLQQAGFSLDETLGLMGMFEESGVDSQRALRGMRTAMNQVESPEELKGVVIDMMDMTDETERGDAAMELFGTTSGEMARALGEGREAFDDMLGTVSGSEGVVSDASNAFDQQLGERFTLLMRDVIDPFREAVGPKFTESLNSTMDWIEGNMPQIQSTMEPIFKGIGTTIGFLIDNLHILGPAIGAAFITVGVPATITLTKTMLALGASMLGVTWPILGIAAAIGVVVGAFIWAWNNWDQITEWFGLSVDWLGEKFSLGLQFIRGFFVDSFTFMRDFGISLWTGFSEGVLGIWDGFTTGISDFVTSLGDGITDGFNSILDFGVGMWEGFSDGILGIWDGLVGGIKGFVNNIISAVNSMISGINSVQIDIPGWVSKIPGVPDMESIGFNIPEIPHLADGGMVTDATLSVIGEGADNEAVIPLNRRIFRLLGSGIADALGFGNLYPDKPEDVPDPGSIIIIDEPDDDDDPEGDGPYHEYNDYDEHYTSYDSDIDFTYSPHIVVNVEGGGSRGDGDRIARKVREELENHYGSMQRRFISKQEG
ncbi:phage tail tape measure protein [Virgibacillus kimchii]